MDVKGQAKGHRMVIEETRLFYRQLEGSSRDYDLYSKGNMMILLNQGSFTKVSPLSREVTNIRKATREVTLEVQV